MTELSSIKALSLRQSAATIGISPATLRNWVKAGHIQPIKKNIPLQFSTTALLRLKTRLETGKLEKLNSRANKTRSLNYHPHADQAVRSIRSTVADTAWNMPPEEKTAEVLFLLALGILQARQPGSWQLKKPGNIKINGSNPLAEELKSWQRQAGFHLMPSQGEKLTALVSPDMPDLLGQIYQLLLREDSKINTGSYYTPEKLVHSIAADLSTPKIKVLDPCCGSGQFLLAFADYGIPVPALHGFDIDPLAVRIARLNLLLKSPRTKCQPEVSHRNTLQEPIGEFYNYFDLIVSNPPWGRSFSSSEGTQLKTRYPEIRSGESFAYFLHRSLAMLRPGPFSMSLPR